MPRLSVIVPVYNVEDYLDECLASLEAQDFDDFEAVCVNDGSPDSSRQILARWAEGHPWVRIVDKENGGLSSARNAGIRAARGTYVCFLDSDDKLLPQACGRIVEALESSGADVLVYGGHALPREASWQWLEYTLTPEAGSYEGFSEQFVFSEKTRPFAWRTAARLDFLLGAAGSPVLFDEDVRYGEDQVFQFLAYALSRRSEVIADRLYEYRVMRTGSLMTGALKDQCDLLCSHVDIMGYVLADYARLGILEACSAPMLRWLARFIAHDALMLDREPCAKVLATLGDLLRTYWNEAGIRAAVADKPVRDSLLLALRRRRPGRLARKVLQVRLHSCLFWDEGIARHSLRRLASKLPSAK